MSWVNSTGEKSSDKFIRHRYWVTELLELHTNREDEEEELDNTQQRLESKYGSIVQKMSSGASFGEVALLTKGSVRLVRLTDF